MWSITVPRYRNWECRFLTTPLGKNRIRFKVDNDDSDRFCIGSLASVLGKLTEEQTQVTAKVPGTLMYQGNYFWITFLGYLQIYEHSINIL
jgi:hypothetical protein